MVTESGNSLVDKRLLGRPRECNRNSTEWNAFKFVFKSYIGVVAPPTLTALNRAETTTDPITIGGLSAEDKLFTRSLSFLLAQVLSVPPLQLMVNVGDQNGLEAWRLLVRSEQPVYGANKIAAMQSILQCKFSPGFDKLEELVQKYQHLVKTYHAVFSEGITVSIAQAVIKSQMPAEIRTHLELQTFTRTTELISLMSSLSKIRRTRTRTRARTRRKGKEKARAKERAMRNPRTRSSKGGVATAENGVTTLPIVGTEMRNRSTKFKAKLARPV